MTRESQLQSMGLQVLSVEEQRDLVGGSWIADGIGWVIGAIAGAVVNLVDRIS